MTEDFHDRAAQWYAAQDADDMDWDGFTAWLEADPRHRAAFDAVALLEDDIARHRDVIVAALNPIDDAPQPRRWRWAIVGGGAIAAALALAVALPRDRADAVWQTGGAVRTVVLADGSRATLAPHSRLVAAGGDQTRLAVSGSAYFDVPHRPGRTLAIDAGRYRITDIGTRFAITTETGATRVAVAEGRLTVSSDLLDAPVPLVAGRTLVARGGAVTVSPGDPAAVASWRRGVLSYDRVPLALVASDIRRYAGAEVTNDPRIAECRFSGTLTIGDGTRMAQAVAAILGIDAVRSGAGVRLEPRR